MVWIACFAVLLAVPATPLPVKEAIMLAPTVSNGAECNLCKDNWLFVLGTGRSGSTSVLTMLNAIPDVYIAGEPKLTMPMMMSMYNERPKEWSADKGDREIKARWHKPTMYHELLCDLQRYIKHAIGQSEAATEKIIGFKDIHAVDESHLWFYKRLFPCARFIVNWRDGIEEDVALQNKALKTVLEAKHMTSSDVRHEIVKKQQWAAKNPDITATLPLHNFTVGNFNRILRWLNVEGCEYTAVAHANNNAGAGPFSADSSSQHKLMSGSCHIREGGINTAVRTPQQFVETIVHSEGKRAAKKKWQDKKWRQGQVEKLKREIASLRRAAANNSTGAHALGEKPNDTL